MTRAVGSGMAKRDQDDEMHPVFAAILGSAGEIAHLRAPYEPSAADACDRCGLPFDRAGRSRTIPKALMEKLKVDDPEGFARGDYRNDYCPRFVGTIERWDCEGAPIAKEPTP